MQLSEKATNGKIPYHRWTHNSDRVLILKCVDANGKGFGGFQWPKKGKVEPEMWSELPTCESGGLFGWAWGIAFGDGKDPINDGKWIVFAAIPEDVVVLDGGKVKARRGEVIFCGRIGDAMQMILPGQIAWCQHFADQAPASSAGDRAPASSAGNYAPASSAGNYAPASSAGDRAPASSAGYRAPASSAGDYAPASSAGDYAPASSAGNYAPASSAGDYAPASSAGDRAPASSAGYYAPAVSTGEGAETMATGKYSIAASTGELSILEVADTSVAVTTAHKIFWRLRAGAVLVQRTESGVWLLRSEDLGADGDLVIIQDGKRVYAAEIKKRAR